MLKITFFLFSSLLLFSSLAFAQEASAPAMMGVKEVIVQYAHIGNPKTADDCGLSREELAGILNKTLADYGVPAIGVTDAKPPTLGVARIDLLPDIFTLSSQGLDCVSWIALTAQSQNTVRILPVDALRNVTVTYWHDGIMVATNPTAHEHAVGEAVEKLAKQFARQYVLDQPPTIHGYDNSNVKN